MPKGWKPNKMFEYKHTGKRQPITEYLGNDEEVSEGGTGYKTNQ